MGVSRGVRALWIAAGSVFTVIIIGFGTAQAVAALAHEERDEHTVVREPVRILDVEVAGSVTVIGTEGRASTTLDERVSDGLQKPDRSIEVIGDRLVVRGTCGEFLATWCGVDVVVQVPASVEVWADATDVRLVDMRGGADITTEGGAIELDDVRGPVRLSSHGGAIAARGLGARRADASSYGGNISLEFTVPPDHVDASSHGGHVVVALPDGPATYRVDTSTAGGSSETLVRTDPESDRVVRAESHGGDVTVRYATE